MTHTTTTPQATPTKPGPLNVGLTGGIGSGKSTVCVLFQALGAPVIDADQTAREVTAPGGEGLNEVVRLFGAGVLTPEGALNRAALREKVFRDPEARKKLEAILHPRIYASMTRQSAALSTPYVIFAVPLLVETGRHRDMDRVLVVDLPEALQIRRVLERDGGDPAQIQAILAAQCSRQARLQAADDVITNAGPPGALEAQVKTLHEIYTRHGSVCLNSSPRGQ